MSPRSANQFTRKRGKSAPDYSSLGKKSVAVGLPDDIIHGPSGLKMSALGTIHEFGSSDGRIPQRSFLRSMLVDRKSDIIRVLKSGANRVASGSNTQDELEKLAIWAENAVKEQIVNVVEPPKAPATLRLDPKKDNPLIFTGEMRVSVIGLVEDND